MGFEDEVEIVRMARPATGTGHTLPDVSGDVRCLPMTVDVLSELSEYDAAAFGAPRRGILAALWERAPAYAQCAWRDGVLAGFCMGRSGSTLEQIGPVVADDVDTAQALFRAALAHAP